MIAALAYSALPPLVLGRMKLEPAKRLASKALLADAEMNKADWMTAVAGIVGIVGIGFGVWWADAAAALMISGEIVWDGVRHMRQAIFDLMDERPTQVEGDDYLGLEEDAEDALLALGWVEGARVRLRSLGEVVVGDAFVTVGSQGLTRPRARQAEEALSDLHWRLHDIVVTYARDADAER